MSDIAYKYFTQLDSLDLSNLEILFDKEINAEEELASALDEKYAYSH